MHEHRKRNGPAKDEKLGGAAFWGRGVGGLRAGGGRKMCVNADCRSKGLLLVRRPSQV